MRRKTKRNTKVGRKFRGFIVGDAIRNKLLRIKKKSKYVVRQSKYPDDDGNYVVMYISDSEHGHNEQRIYKGTQKECYLVKTLKEGGKIE